MSKAARDLSTEVALDPFDSVKDSTRLRRVEGHLSRMAEESKSTNEHLSDLCSGVEVLVGVAKGLEARHVASEQAKVDREAREHEALLESKALKTKAYVRLIEALEKPLTWVLLVSALILGDIFGLREVVLQMVAGGIAP